MRKFFDFLSVGTSLESEMKSTIGYRYGTVPTSFHFLLPIVSHVLLGQLLPWCIAKYAINIGYQSIASIKGFWQKFPSVNFREISFRDLLSIKCRPVPVFREMRNE